MTDAPELRCVCRLNLFACPQHPRTWTAQNVGAWWDIKIEPPVPVQPGEAVPSLTPAQVAEAIREADTDTVPPPRRTASTISDDELDQLYAVIAEVRRLAEKARRTPTGSQAADVAIQGFTATILRALDGTTPTEPQP